jgi:glyoxylase-like metal-dependent hydrolase (beta-lactamase superfamily II)
MNVFRAIGLAIATFAVSFSATAAQMVPLQLTVYNPGTKGIFPVSSVLVTGARDAILIDAQFGGSQAAEVVDVIRKSGKRLTTIYISHGDPDYYFGLDKITAEFPDARVLATPQTVAHIHGSMKGKLEFWGPTLGADAPRSLVVPQALQGDSLELEGRRQQVIGLHSAQPERTFVWIPFIGAVVGGIVLFNNMHVWMADTQTPQSHADWLATLTTIDKLKPLTMVPGHYLVGPSTALQAPAFTADYIREFDEEAASTKDYAWLASRMTAAHPQAGGAASLELSAKVAKGEIPWATD